MKVSLRGWRADALAFLVTAVVAGVGPIFAAACNDRGPQTPEQIDNTMQPCAGMAEDGGMLLCPRDGFACPMYRGSQCVMQPIAMCAAPPCPGTAGAGVRRSDAAVTAATDASRADANAARDAR